MADESLQITPDTKIGELLDAYPQIEELLIEIAPAFKKLKNPILRKTVAKVTSIRQAARVGGVPLGTMVNRLRMAAGQSAIEYEDSNQERSETDAEIIPADRIFKTLDAREMIEAGEQPLGKVLSDLRQMPQGAIYELITPFEPAPLVDKAKSQGFKTEIRRKAADIYVTYFRHDKS